MTEELITPENLSVDLLKSIVDAAYMQSSFDAEGDLIVRENVNCWILPNRETKDKILLLCIFGFAPHVSQMQRLESANQINLNYGLVTAFVGSNDSLRFRYEILVAGGITKKAFVLGVKRFCAVPHYAIADYAKGLLI